MGKIYEGNVKLNTLQVCDKIRNVVTFDQAKQFNPSMPTGHISNYKKTFAHMVLDSYRFLPSETEEDMEFKKMCKHLMDKYMKSNSTDTSEESAFKLVIECIQDMLAKH